MESDIEPLFMGNFDPSATCNKKEKKLPDTCTCSALLGKTTHKQGHFLFQDFNFLLQFYCDETWHEK